MNLKDNKTTKTMTMP